MCEGKTLSIKNTLEPAILSTIEQLSSSPRRGLNDAVLSREDVSSSEGQLPPYCPFHHLLHSPFGGVCPTLSGRLAPDRSSV